MAESLTTDELLPEIATRLREWFPELGDRALAVSEALITKTNVPTLPLAMVAPLTQRFTHNGNQRMTVEEGFMIEFWLVSSREKGVKGETPFWSYYEYNGLRNRLFSLFAGYRGVDNATIRFVSMEIDANEFAVIISFRMAAAYDVCADEEIVAACDPHIHNDGEPARISYSLCQPQSLNCGEYEVIVPDPDPGPDPGPDPEPEPEPDPVLFSDDFNREDQNLEAVVSWTRFGQVGSAAIRSNALAALPATAGAGGLFLCPDVGSADHFIEFTLRSLGDGNSGSFVLCRSDTSGSNFVGIRVTPSFLTDGIEIYRRVADTLTPLYVGQSIAALDDVLRLGCFGPNWTVNKNGVFVSSGAIGDGGVLASNTRQGVIARIGDQNQWIDDVKVGITSA